MSALKTKQETSLLFTEEEILLINLGDNPEKLDNVIWEKMSLKQQA